MKKNMVDKSKKELLQEAFNYSYEYFMEELTPRTLKRCMLFGESSCVV